MPSSRKRRWGRYGLKGLLLDLIVVAFIIGGIFLCRRIFFKYPRRIPESKGGPQIAVVLDDHGYRFSDCEYLSATPFPVSISILPDLEYSGEIALCAKRAGQEVMLHLPLEPTVNQKNYPENYIIKTDFSKGEITKNISDALASVPYASGVNNHMGSKATADPRVMSVIFNELRRKKLFFVDSRSTLHTVCRAAAARARIPFAERDVFLDNENDRAYIEGQFERLAAKAREQGYAIGIGHARDLTWEVTAEKLREFAKRGFEITTVQRMIETHHENSRH